MEPQAACAALCQFRSVQRRLQKIHDQNDIRVYYDFAHHPAAIEATLGTLREAFPQRRLIVALEPASYTMRHGSHGARLGRSLRAADHVFLYRDHDAHFSLGVVLHDVMKRSEEYKDINALHDAMCNKITGGDVVVLMSNAAFAGLAGRLPQSLCAPPPRTLQQAP